MSQPKIRKKIMREQQTDGPKADTTFKCAESYFLAATILNRHILPLNLMLMWPVIVCEAFGLELYLKAFILLEGSEYTGTHDLQKLFDRISPENRAIIKTLCEPRLAQMSLKMNLAQRQSAIPVIR